ncbi:CCA tRNA nucleotidyltransferase [Halomarina salina]|uniref:CCA-adding enzyme n=1 Tax=Halomarina salina TaxID=1872699 RepID=A0ABD5RL08_9EURY|nr:CCA tRNA nucleotidyltransferase [Halomarina salina]
MDEFERVVATVGERVTPDAAERERLAATADRVVSRAEAAIADLTVEADVVQVGSTARGTWLAGDRDIDVFVRFPPDLPRDDLESYGLQVGRAAVPDGREEYAEHPYIKGEVDGFEVDCVPCYRVPTAPDIQSAVDRTPFHNRYLLERIDAGLASEVRLAKAFLKGIGAYGSDLRTKGFSGYLTELLVLEYGDFRALLDAAADWHPPVVLDPEDHATREHGDPLVVVDPTDPERNVAAVCSPTNVARLTHYARQFLDAPDESFFEPRDPDPLSGDAMRDHLDRRGTTPVAVRFDAPDVVEDQLYPQLEKSLSGVVGGLDRNGFDVLRAEAWAEAHSSSGADDDVDAAPGDDADDGPADATWGDAVLFCECEVVERPAIERHRGPPVSVGDHATGFYDAYSEDDVYGPFLDGDRYVVERERPYHTASDLLDDGLFEVSLGVHVERSLRDGYDVLVGGECVELTGSFGEQLARYFDPRP